LRNESESLSAASEVRWYFVLARLSAARGRGARLLGILVTGIHAVSLSRMLRVRPPGCRDWIKKSWPLCRCRSDRLAACVVEGTKLQALASNVRHTSWSLDCCCSSLAQSRIVFFLHLASGSRSLRCFATVKIMRNNSIYRVTCLHVHEKSNLFRYKICQNTSVIGEEDMFPLVPRLPDGQRCILPHVLNCRFSVDIFQFPRSIAESSEREGSVHAAERAIFQVRIKQRQPHPH
ncbi:hypothetical protein KCU87_g7, partial [Aureobasidium melanogenum]